MRIGTVNESLVPVVPVNLKRKDNHWQELELLLDTGFDGEIALDTTLLDSCNLATRPDHQMLTPEDVLRTRDNWGASSPYTGESFWEGRTREVGIRLMGEQPIHGILGTNLLKYRTLTVDAVQGGQVTLEDTSPPVRNSSTRRWFSTVKNDRILSPTTWRNTGNGTVHSSHGPRYRSETTTAGISQYGLTLTPGTTTNSACPPNGSTGST